MFSRLAFGDNVFKVGDSLPRDGFRTSIGPFIYHVNQLAAFSLQTECSLGGSTASSCSSPEYYFC